jgi:hypothetical protein
MMSRLNRNRTPVATGIVLRTEGTTVRGTVVRGHPKLGEPAR